MHSTVLSANSWISTEDNDGDWREENFRKPLADPLGALSGIADSLDTYNSYYSYSTNSLFPFEFVSETNEDLKSLLPVIRDFNVVVGCEWRWRKRRIQYRKADSAMYTSSRRDFTQ